MLFSAEIIDFKILYNVLKALNLTEFAILRPLDAGLKITLEEMRCSETSVYFPREMFLLYEKEQSEDIFFKINLKVLTECLNIFGDDGNPSLKLQYKDSGSPLILILKHLEENIIVDCEIKTFITDEFQVIGSCFLSDECNVNKIVLEANIFQELLFRLDNGADEVKIKMSPDFPYFELTATGRGGESHVTISKKSDAVIVHECSKTLEAQYVFQNLRQLLKVMNYANKISLSMGESGLLEIQLVINSDEKEMYIEFYLTALVNE